MMKLNNCLLTLLVLIPLFTFVNTTTAVVDNYDEININQTMSEGERRDVYFYEIVILEKQLEKLTKEDKSIKKFIRQLLSKSDMGKIMFGQFSKDLGINNWISKIKEWFKLMKYNTHIQENIVKQEIFVMRETLRIAYPLIKTWHRYIGMLILYAIKGGAKTKENYDQHWVAKAKKFASDNKKTYVAVLEFIRKTLNHIRTHSNDPDKDIATMEGKYHSFIRGMHNFMYQTELWLRRHGVIGQEDAWMEAGRLGLEKYFQE